MNAIYVLFRTGRFNLSKPLKHFVNPDCFGEDLASWLRSILAASGTQVSEPVQQDGGWALRARDEKDVYLLAISGDSDNGANRNYGEWRIIVMKKRSIWRRITGTGRIAQGDQMVESIESILREQPDFADIHRAAELA